MSEKIAYSESIINIAAHQPAGYYGEYEILQDVLTLKGSAGVKYAYDYNLNTKQIKTDQFVLSLNVKGNNDDISTRYSTMIRLRINIQYYKPQYDEQGVIIGYEDGDIKQFNIFPYLISESNGGITNYELDVDDEYIKQIEINFINQTEYNISFYNVNFAYKVTLNKAITDGAYLGISLTEVNILDNAFSLLYNNENTRDNFYWLGYEDDDIRGIDINHAGIIKINKLGGILP